MSHSISQKRAARLAERAERGEIRLKVLPIVVAEVVWVLSSFYKYSRVQVAEVLLELLIADGVDLQEAEQVLSALKQMAKLNVDFADAYLAEVGRREGEAVVSFDRDFRRLDVAWIEPN